MAAPTTVDVYQVLCEIRDIGKMHNQMLADVRELAKLQLVSLDSLLTFAQARSQRTATQASANIANDAELDGRYGNPEIKAKDPRDWTGEPMLGRTFSECPPEYLDLLAERYDYFNTQLGTSTEDQKKRKYNALDAGKARGWAVRLRAGWKPLQQPEAPAENPFGESVDF